MDESSLPDWLARTALLKDAPGEVLALCRKGARVVEVAAGGILIRAGTRTGSLYLLARGTAEVRLPGRVAGEGALARLGEGKVFGEIQAVTGQPAAADVIATTPCTALELDRTLLRAIAERFPAFDERLARIASRNLRSIVFHRAVHELMRGVNESLLGELVAGADEVVLERGETLFSQGDNADAWYVLTSGRLSVVTATADGSRKVADLLPGESVGEMALIAGGPRSATVKAERKASLMRVSRAGFERFADQHPAFARALMGTIVRRLADPSTRLSRGGLVLVVMRASGEPLLAQALQQLGGALPRVADAAICTREAFEAAIGRGIDAGLPESHPIWSRFDVWLEDAQRAHPLVLVDGGHADDAWRRECLLHADRCAWLAEPVPEDATQPPEADRAALHAAMRSARRDTRRLAWWLVLAHPVQTRAPANTRAWLHEGAFDRHFHVRVDAVDTMERTARLLAGRGIGLALSGGGARGFAHIGVLKAFLERGIPIDCIGGTSFGAIQAAMFAMGLSIERMRTLNLEVVAARPFAEYTLPVIAMVASKRRDACIRHSFGDARIEDLWIPYLAVSTDLRAAQAVAHERGSLGLAASASSSLPGVLVPVIDGERILVDGGIVDNLPADLVKQRAGGPVFGVKVAPDDDLVIPEGGFPSAWRYLWSRIVPGAKRLRTPRLGDILVRTMTVGSAERMAEVARSVDVLIEPDVASFGMLQFKAIDALIDRGYVAATKALGDWRR